MGENILGLEGEVAWTTPGSWTEINFPCAENGKNFNGGKHLDGKFDMDPSNDAHAVQRRLESDNH